MKLTNNPYANMQQSSVQKQSKLVSIPSHKPPSPLSSQCSSHFPYNGFIFEKSKVSPLCIDTKEILSPVTPSEIQTDKYAAISHTNFQIFHSKESPSGISQNSNMDINLTEEESAWEEAELRVWEDVRAMARLFDAAMVMYTQGTQVLRKNNEVLERIDGLCETVGMGCNHRYHTFNCIESKTSKYNNLDYIKEKAHEIEYLNQKLQSQSDTITALKALQNTLSSKWPTYNTLSSDTPNQTSNFGPSHPKDQTYFQTQISAKNSEILSLKAKIKELSNFIKSEHPSVDSESTPQPESLETEILGKEVRAQFGIKEAGNINDLNKVGFQMLIL